MAKYKERPLNGAQWQRCRTVTVQMPYDDPAVAYFQEEEVLSAGPNTNRRDVDYCAIELGTTTSFQLRDPETGAPSGGSMTHNELKAALFSLYMVAAAARDAG